MKNGFLRDRSVFLVVENVENLLILVNNRIKINRLRWSRLVLIVSFEMCISF